MTTAEKLYTTLQTLPEPLLQEVLDFTEFLSKREPPLKTSNSTALCDVIGGLETSTMYSTNEPNGAKLARLMKKIAQRGTAFQDIKDPAAWQREIRKDRPLPGRE